MDQKFIREKKELAYHAHIFDVYNDYLRLPDGKHVVYDLVNHVDGCCVLPVDEDGNLILVSQYRNAVWMREKIRVSAQSGNWKRKPDILHRNFDL